jgi:SAM-dependent methyltransferase
MTEPRARRNVFGEAADEYEAVRPGYPAALVTDLLAEAGAGPVLEVGAGTGKATAQFAAYGIDLLCLEPDARMAALLTARHLPNVTVVVDQFETWPPERGYSLVYSAQAWHWIDTGKRNDLAWAALAPGGLLALFWNGFMLADDALHADLIEVDRGYFPAGEQTSHNWRRDTYPARPGSFAEEWADLALHDDPRFTDLRSRNYPSTIRYSSTDYARLLATTSLYRMLEPAVRADVLAATTAVVDRHGGEIELTVDTSVATARRAA